MFVGKELQLRFKTFLTRRYTGIAYTVNSRRLPPPLRPGIAVLPVCLDVES